MSRKYKHGDRVPSEVLAKRLDELATVVTNGKEAIAREFVMCIPAELDHCPDLVMSQSAMRLNELETAISNMQSKIDALMLEYCPNEMTTDQMKKWEDSQKLSDLQLEKP